MQVETSAAVVPAAEQGPSPVPPLVALHHRPKARWGMTTTPTRPARTGLDLQWVDPGTRPQDDLFGHVNGRWLRTHEIPDDRAQDGAFRALRDRAEENVHAIIEQAT